MSKSLHTHTLSSHLITQESRVKHQQRAKEVLFEIMNASGKKRSLWFPIKGFAIIQIPFFLLDQAWNQHNPPIWCWSQQHYIRYQLSPDPASPRSLPGPPRWFLYTRRMNPLTSGISSLVSRRTGSMPCHVPSRIMSTQSKNATSRNSL